VTLSARPSRCARDSDRSAIRVLLLSVCVAALGGCGGGTDAAAPLTLAEGADTTIFASQSALGPHVMNATVRRTVRVDGAPESVTEESVSLRWKDQDHWALERSRDGRPSDAVTVWDGVAWTEGVRRPDAEPYRVMLAHTWDPWRLAFEQFEAGLQLEEDDVDVRSGRKAHRHEVSVRPAPEPPADGKGKRRARTPRPSAFEVRSAAGEVWIDQATAVRLAADVRVEAVSGAQTHLVELRFSVDGIGGDPGVTAPIPSLAPARDRGTPPERRGGPIASGRAPVAVSSPGPSPAPSPAAAPSPATAAPAVPPTTPGDTP
jgi:hypothetical protein